MEVLNNLFPTITIKVYLDMLSKKIYWMYNLIVKIGKAECFNFMSETSMKFSQLYKENIMPVNQFLAPVSQLSKNWGFKTQQ